MTRHSQKLSILVVIIVLKCGILLMSRLFIYCDKGGGDMSTRSVVDRVVHHFRGDMLSLHYPGVATLLVFRKYVHVAANLRLVDHDQDEYMDEYIRTVGKQIVN